MFYVLLSSEDLTQNDLCRITELSKSTVSRAISRLEAKGLVIRRRYGISNFISLNKEFFEKSKNTENKFNTSKV